MAKAKRTSATRILRHDHSPISSWTKNEQIKRRRKTQNKNRTEPSMLHSQNLISRPAWSCNSWTPQWTRAPSQHARSNTQNGCCDHCSNSTTSSNNNNGTPFQKPVECNVFLNKKKNTFETRTEEIKNFKNERKNEKNSAWAFTFEVRYSVTRSL